jgi:hypothetical protein
LPDGCFIQLDGYGYLFRQNALSLWTPEEFSAKDASRTYTHLLISAAQAENSGEAERLFRMEAGRHPGMNPNTIGA